MSRILGPMLSWREKAAASRLQFSALPQPPTGVPSLPTLPSLSAYHLLLECQRARLRDCHGSINGGLLAALLALFQLVTGSHCCLQVLHPQSSTELPRFPIPALTAKMATKAHKTNWDFRSREIAAQHLSHPPATTTTSPCADDANHNRRCVKCNEDHRELMFLISSDLKLDDWCFTCRFDHRIQSLIDEAGDHPSGERDGWIIDMTEKGRGILREFALSQMRRWRADNVEKHGLQLTDEEQASS